MLCFIWLASALPVLCRHLEKTDSVLSKLYLQNWWCSISVLASIRINAHGTIHTEVNPQRKREFVRVFQQCFQLGYILCYELPNQVISQAWTLIINSNMATSYLLT